MVKIKFAAACAAMALFASATLANAQQGQTPAAGQNIPGAVTRIAPVAPAALLQPITSQLRAEIAGRALGLSGPAPNVTGTAWVTPQYPYFGSGEMALNAYSPAGGFSWETTQVSFATPSTGIVVNFRTAARARHLVICDLNAEGNWTAWLNTTGASVFEGVPIAVTWESGRAIFLIPAADRDRQIGLRLSSSRANGQPLAIFRRCEVSRIG